MVETLRQPDRAPEAHPGGVGDAVKKPSIDCSHLYELAFISFDKVQWDHYCLPQGSKNLLNIRSMAAGSF